MNTLINGVNYSYGDISVMLFGTIPLIGIESIEYDEEQEMENNYGAGNFPIGQGFGAFKYSGKMRLYKEQILPFINMAPMKKIQLIPPFNVKSVYGNSVQAVVTDTLTNCVFKKNPFAAKQGDKKIVADFELLIGGINWNS